VNTLVSGAQSYTVMERWRRSRDESTLTITRTIARGANETQSILVYENGTGPTLLTSREPERRAPETVREPVREAVNLPVRPAEPTARPAESEGYLVEAGTRVLLRLTNSVNTKHSAPGDRIYLETTFPVYVSGRVVIPRGSYVIGTVTDAHQAGRVKGKSALTLRFDSLTLANGVTRDLRSRPGSVDGRGTVDREEGKVEGDGNKGGDARTVATTTAAGTGIGAVAGAAGGHLGMGAGIGAAAGAAAGLAGVLGGRGPDVVLPTGTTMELVLDRDLRFTDRELGRIQ
jgi:hypothetical protein